jgi:hypothetical protein
MDPRVMSEFFGALLNHAGAMAFVIFERIRRAAESASQASHEATARNGGRSRGRRRRSSRTTSTS